MQRDYYVFDPASGRFISNALTEDLAKVKSSRIVLSKNTQEIQAPFFKGRCTGEDTYRIENGRLEKVEEQQVTPRGDECRIETRQSRNGSWQIVRTSMTLDMSDPGF